jgi:hypothetical protein
MAQRNNKQQYHSGKNPDFFQRVGNSKHSIIQETIPFRNRHFSTSDKAQVGSNTSAKNHAIRQFCGAIKLPTDKHSEKAYLYSGRDMRVATGTQKE